MKNVNKSLLRHQRKRHIRKKIFGSNIAPRLSVFRSIRYINIQIINDNYNVTMTSISSSSSHVKNISYDKNKSSQAFIIGKICGELLLKKGIKKVSFDRNGFKYHGRISKLVDGIRSTGIYL